MIVTIDGPAGTGKSTVARLLAERLGFAYMDTGAMYRAVALACLESGIDPHDSQRCSELASGLPIRIEGTRTYLKDRDVSEEIRSSEVTEAASVIAQNPAIRAHLVGLQQSLARQGNIICEGRDQGTVAFPQAECKFFLGASPEVRARRRREELLDKGIELSLEEVLQQQTERDQRDSLRKVAPLQPADDAHLIDTSNLSIEEVVQQLEQIIREKH